MKIIILVIMLICGAAFAEPPSAPTRTVEESNAIGMKRMNTPQKSKPDATEVVYRLYRDYAWEALGLDSGDSKAVGPDIAFESKIVLERYFDAELSSLLVKDAKSKERANGEESRLEFDPIFASQDPAAYELKVRLKAPDIVRVTFTYPSSGEKVVLEYKVTYGSKGWRISDINYITQGGITLKKILLR